MSKFLRSRWVWPAWCALVVAGFLGQLARYYHPVYGFTSLLQLDATSEPAMLRELRERPVYVYRDTGGYDGQYYAQIAARPMLRDPALRDAIDNLNYRARRSLGSWVAWAVAGGDATRAVDVYSLLNPFCWLVLAGLLLAVFPPRTGFEVLAWMGVLGSAGVLASVRLALTDLPALTLMVGAAVAVQRGRSQAGTGLLAAAVLARETSLLALPVFGEKTARGWLVRAVCCLGPLALWYGYIRYTVGPGADGWDNLTWPGLIFLKKWRFCLADLGNEKFTLLAWTTLLSMIALTVQAAWLIVRRAWRNLWWRFGIGHVGLMLLLGWAPWEGYPGAACRVLLPLQVAFNALVPRTRRGLILLVLGNLSCASGLVCFFEVPHERDEWAAARIEGSAYLVRLGPGWHDPEQRRTHRWCWADREATLRLQVWHGVAPVRVTFKLHAFAGPRTITVRQGERVLWSGRLERGDVPVAIAALEFPPDGNTELRFTSEEPAVKENESAQARTIAFSISDFEMGPTK